MEIRELTGADLNSLIELYAQLDEVNISLDIEKSRSVWSMIELNPYIKYFGAVDGARVVSTCYAVIIPNLTNYGQSVCFVENVVTDVHYRNQGLGKKVIGMAVEFAKKNDCYKVILQSGSQRVDAHRFYTNLGFDGNIKKAFDMRLHNKKES